MASPIIWQSSDRGVTLLDIPTSILNAQEDDDNSIAIHLLSTPPVQTPFPSNEPKSASARAKLQSSAATDVLHAQYEALLRQAIERIKAKHTGDWCLPRNFVEEPLVATRKRGQPDSDDVSAATKRDVLPESYLSNIARVNLDRTSAVHMSEPLNMQRPDESKGQSGLVETTEGLSLCNSTQQTRILRITSNQQADAFSFRIPPRAAFYLGDCTGSKSFRDTVRKHAEAADTRSGFDFILLDPPWPNRSVKRTHKTPGTTYTTSSSLEEIRDLILKTHLEILMEDQCYVGIWITNKPSIRDLVVGENGIFDCWNVELAEEWVWLKTTVRGEPVTPLNGIWRKPYEVLLLGRRRRKNAKVWEERTLAQDIRRRVIVGVPDLHSRKPCLKTLIEPMMDSPTDYRALEVFARHLVAGWWSWGDECIKFNWDGYWRTDAEKTTSKVAAHFKSDS